MSELNMQPHMCTHTYAIKYIHHAIHIIYHVHYQRTGEKEGEEEERKEDSITRFQRAVMVKNRSLGWGDQHLKALAALAEFQHPHQATHNYL